MIGIFLFENQINQDANGAKLARGEICQAQALSNSVAFFAVFSLTGATAVGFLYQSIPDMGALIRKVDEVYGNAASALAVKEGENGQGEMQVKTRFLSNCQIISHLRPFFFAIHFSLITDAIMTLYRSFYDIWLGMRHLVISLYFFSIVTETACRVMFQAFEMETNPDSDNIYSSQHIVIQLCLFFLVRTPIHAFIIFVMREFTSVISTPMRNIGYLTTTMVLTQSFRSLEDVHRKLIGLTGVLQQGKAERGAKRHQYFAFPPSTNKFLSARCFAHHRFDLPSNNSTDRYRYWYLPVQTR